MHKAIKDYGLRHRCAHEDARTEEAPIPYRKVGTIYVRTHGRLYSRPYRLLSVADFRGKI